MDSQIAQFILALAAGLLLLSAGAQDIRTREIANRKCAMLVLLAPAWWWATGMALWPDALLQMGLGLAMFVLFALAFRVGMMGGGDVKLIAALALWLPPAALIGMLTIMSLVGGAVTLAMLVARGVRHRRTKGPLPPIEVPYGVAIAVAGLLVLRQPILNQFG